MGSLHGNQRPIIALIGDDHVKTFGALREGGHRRITVGSVSDDQILLRGESIDDQVIDHATFGAEEQRVLSLVILEDRQAVTEGIIQEVSGTRSNNRNLRHVGEVEHSGAFSHRVVFHKVRFVTHRHVIAGKIREGRTRALVRRMKGGVLTHGSPGVFSAGDQTCPTPPLSLA